jgi:hypothetical protein
MALNTDFNVSPYYDDYNEDKNFHRVLFRPAVPIQARELTQLQTILQNQVERFGDNIYRQGTIIKGCALSLDSNYTYVKIGDLQVDGQSTLVSDYANGYVQDSANLKSEIVNYVQGLESQNPDLSTLFVKYINTGTGGKKKYANSDVLTVYARDYSIQSINITAAGANYSNSDTITFSGGGGTGASANIVTTTSGGAIIDIVISSGGSGYLTAPTLTITTTTGSSGALTALNYIAQVRVANSSYTAPVGTGAAVSVGDGIIYQKGHFVRVEEQTTITSKYSNQPNNVALGFTTVESVVNNSVESTLLDNAQGYSNYTAPGAHRLKLTPSLVAISVANAASNSEFLSILEFQNGNITKRKTSTEFNSVSTEFAKRTREESGNYVVKPFNLYTEDKVSNTSHLNLSVSSGLGYVDGFRVELTGTVRVPISRGKNNTITSVNQTISTNYGNYVIVDEVLGNFDFSAGATINLRNTAGDDVTNTFGGAPTTPGTIIGTAKIKSFVYLSGVIGTPSCKYKLYLFDVRMEPGEKFSSVKSLQVAGGIADAVLEDSVAVLKETSYDSLIFSSGASAVSYFTNEQFIYRKAATSTFQTTGIGTVSVSGTADEKFPYSVSSTLNDTQELDFIVIPSTNAHSTTSLTGTVTSSVNVITGTGNFIADLDVGDYVKFSGNTTYFRVSSITNATSMTVYGATGPNVSSNTISYAFPKNVPVRLDRGTANISIDSNGNAASIFLGSGIDSTTSTTVYTNVKANNAIQKAKTVAKDVYIKLSTVSVSANTDGPWCLGIPDAYKINAVYVGTSNTYSNTTTNYASSFELITGQSDNLYGLSYLRKKPGSLVTLTATSCLLVNVKAFTHGTGYYISTESYPVDDDTNPLPANKIRTEDIPYYISPKTSKYYNLRDVVDFRPIVANTANVSSTVAGATVDPATTETLTGSIYFPAPNQSFEADVTHYLRRIDTIVIDAAGSVSVIEGVPEDNPVPPRATDSTMKLGTIEVPPYPALSPQAAALAQRNDYSTLVRQDQVKGYTMKDIKQIEDRINRIEYYSLLNTLEKDTTDLIIPSESNTSLSRFKNGFFAESFSSYDISNINDNEYRIYIDTTTSTARPQINKHKVALVANTGASSNVTFKGEYALLNYTDQVFLQQPIANKTRNPTQLNWNFRGTAQLYPKYDDYYDVDKGSVNVTIDLATPIQQLATAINSSVVFKADAKQITTSASAYTSVTPPTTTSTGLDQRTISTTTTTTTGSIQPGSTITNIQHVGDFVTDFGMNPFIRSQWVTFVAVGLRPSATHYVFFDKVDVSAQCRPASVSSIDTMDPAGLKQETTASWTGPKGSTLTTDTNGTLVGALYIPENTFFCGERSLLISDTNDIDSTDTSISSAIVQFNAYNFSKDVSSLTISTKTPSTVTAVSNTTTDVAKIIQNRVVPRVSPPFNCCCFIAGTKILMADGSIKNIEDVMLGDVVLGKDGSHNEVLEFLRPTLGDTGATMMAFNGEMPFMTSDHPVYVRGYGWKSFDPKMTEQKYFMPVGKYQVGDIIETPDGLGFEIKSIEEYTDQNQDQIIYNFRLGGNHTYIADGLIVHNKCFIAGTEVLLEDNTWKKIEDVGLDQILIGQDGSKNKILKLHRPKLGINDDWLPHKQRMVSINGSEFATSEDHMFFTTTGWKAPDAESCNLVHEHTIAAEGFVVTDLQIGDYIVKDNGDTVEVRSIEFRDDNPELQLYNFWTDGNHTYHVKMKDSQDGMLVHNKCFIAGTKVLMQDGTWENIEDVKLDEVLIGKDGSKNKILRLHRPTLGLQDDILPHKLRLACINGKEYSASEDHIFSTENGWKAPNAAISKIIHKHTIEAEGFDVTDLQVGDNIITHDGRTVEVKSLEFKEDDPNTQLYNFWTDGNHTYHVKMAGHDDGMLVHNKCFVAGTEVLLRDGTWRNIEDITLEDTLLGENGSENKVKDFHRPVLGLNDHILPHKLRLASINGSEFAVSEDHMIKTTSGWKTPTVEMCKILHAETLKNEKIDINQLMIGDEIICSDNSLVKVDSVEFKEDTPDLQLYNFKLHGNKTYHVRLKGTDKFILVHNKDPISQTFNINQTNGESGVFVTKVDLYFKTKDADLGITVQIRATENGYPSPTVLAQRFVKSSSINVSNTAALATTVTFDTPVYLTAGSDYCIVVKPDQDNPSYQMWVAETGIADVANNSLLSTKNWGSGVLFLSQNDTTWTPYQTEDIKFTVYTANFTTSSGVVAFDNEPYEFLSLSSNTQGSFIVSEEVAQKSNTYLSGLFTSNTTSAVVNTTVSQTSTLAVGDYVLIVYANTSVLKTGTVTVSNTTTTTVTGSGTNFAVELDPGDYLRIGGDVREVTVIANSTQITIDAPLSASVSSNVFHGVSNKFQVSRVNGANTSTITLKDIPYYNIDGGTTYYGAVQKVVRGVVDKINKDNTLVITNSSASNTTFRMTAGRTIVGEESQASATIASVDNKVVNFTESHIRYGTPPQTSTTLAQKIDGTGSVTTSISDGISNSLKYVGELKSRSNEIVSGNNSLKVFATISKPTSLTSISPFIDTSPASMVVLENLINNVSTNETTTYGNSQAKYVSKSVVLADGLDAEDLKVFITAYKPSYSDILVYAKVLASDDNTKFIERDWTLLNQVTEAGLYSDSLNENNFIEYEYGFKYTPPSTALTGVVVSSSNTTLTGSGTTFTTDLAANSVIKVVQSNTLTGYDIAVVDAVANNTSLTLKANTSFTSSTASIEKVTQTGAAFKYNRESNIVTYFDKNKGRHSSYKTFAIKVVLVSSSTKYVPILKDLRALAVSI